MTGRQGDSPDRLGRENEGPDIELREVDTESPNPVGDAPWARPSSETSEVSDSSERSEPVQSSVGSTDGRKAAHHDRGDGGSGDDAIDDEGGGGGGDAHLGWKLSALLDGELTVPDELMARRHLEGCVRCQTEFAQVNAARTLVQGLGPVDPPAGFFERMVIAGESVTGRNRGFGVAGLVSMALVWVLILLFVVRLALPEVVPAVGLVADSAAMGELSSGVVVTADDLPPPFTMPAAIGEFELLTAREVDEGVLLLLDNGDSVVVVLQQEGTLDTASTRNLRRVVLGDAEGWETAASGMAVVIVSDAHVVWTIAASDPAAAREVATQRPDPAPYSMADRVANNFEDLGDRLGL